MSDPVSKAYLLTPHSAGPFALLWLMVFCPAFYIQPHNPMNPEHGLHGDAAGIAGLRLGQVHCPRRCEA